MTENAANNKRTAKRKRKPTPASWKPGQSGNPKGAPKRGMSIREAYEWALSINADEMADILAAGGRNDLSEAFRHMPKGIELKTLWAARILAATMFEPQPGLVNHIADRVEGPVTEKIEHSGSVRIIDVTLNGDDSDTGTD